MMSDAPSAKQPISPRQTLSSGSPGSSTLPGRFSLFASGSGNSSQGAPGRDKPAFVKLSAQTIQMYLGSLTQPYLQSFANAEKIVIEEIGDGNLNFVFRVKKPDSNESIIIKQAVPFLRCVGEHYPLSEERMRFEIAYALRASQLQPQFIPRLYHVDPDHYCVMIMQDLNQHRIMREGLIQGIIYPQFANHISTFMAEMLFKTSRLNLSGEEHAKLVAQFNGNRLCDLTENFFFSYAFMQHDSNQQSVQFSYLFRKHALDLRRLFATEIWGRQEAFVLRSIL
jgi:5-methylthioribose kinase